MMDDIGLKGVEPRRSEDQPGENHTRERHVYVVRESTHTKWVIRIVSAALVAALGFFALEDRNNMDSKATAALNLATANAMAVGKMDTKLDDIKDAVDEVKDELRDQRRGRTHAAAAAAAP